jgi:polyisoprenoid-binding protein YceI
MQEHFNENYLESDKYPKSEFKGTITGSESIDYQKEGRYQVRVKGKLFLHGETQEIATDAQLEIRNGRISATAVIDVRLSDYKVSIPGLVADKVGKVAHIKVSCSLELLNN